MKLKLIVTKNCLACARAETSLRKIAGNYPGLYLNIVDANDFKEKPISIVPALLVDDELFSYGDIDEEKVLAIVTSK